MACWKVGESRFAAALSSLAAAFYIGRASGFSSAASLRAVFNAPLADCKAFNWGVISDAAACSWVSNSSFITYFPLVKRVTEGKL